MDGILRVAKEKGKKEDERGRERREKKRERKMKRGEWKREKGDDRFADRVLFLSRTM